MTKKRKPSVTKKKTKTAPPLTEEGREKRLIDKSLTEAERRIEAGTVSSQVLTHFLRLGTERERKEMQILEEEIALKRARTEAYQSTVKLEELYAQAVRAMSEYAGEEISDE
jgi:hypothetical protein